MVEKFFRIPFANSGTATAIPDASQPDGSVSYTDGFTPDYSLDQATNPSAKDVPRGKTNGLFKAITEALRQLQTTSVPSFITTAANDGVPYSYALGVRVQWTDGLIYQSRVDNNTSDPTDTTKWAAVTDSVSIPDASTTVKGILELATAAEAIGGTDNARAVTSAGLAGFKNLATNGYMTFPGGLILQWGEYTGTTNQPTITFPISFPTKVLYVDGMYIYSTNAWQINPFAVTVNNWVANQFNPNNNAPVGVPFVWFAVGY